MQNETERTVQELAREIIIQNVQKGQMYRVKFSQDPVIYEGMPIALPGMLSGEDEVFEMRVVGPSQEGAVLRRAVGDISWIREFR
ncbi:MAG: hypothetical protein K9N49_03255 [Candidatus Marinimicrobia bacterium]|nr:hypothetical protein [Candidatus Neomarinimicrobiota bacterium]